MREMISRYDDVARESGATLLHFCGHDGIPWELSVQLLANEMQKRHGDALASVDCLNEVRGAASGGTLATVFHHASASPGRKHKFDPLLAAGGVKSASRTVNRSRKFLGRNRAAGVWVGPSFMASINGEIVKRGNALGDWTPSLRYSEAHVYPSLSAGIVTIVTLVVLVHAVLFPPLRWLLLRTGALPSPGQGPSRRAREKGACLALHRRALAAGGPHSAGWLQVTATGVGLRTGKRVVSTMYFPRDAGYSDTVGAANPRRVGRRTG